MNNIICPAPTMAPVSGPSNALLRKLSPPPPPPRLLPDPPSPASCATATHTRVLELSAPLLPPHTGSHDSGGGARKGVLLQYCYRDRKLVLGVGAGKQVCERARVGDPACVTLPKQCQGQMAKPNALVGTAGRRPHQNNHSCATPRFPSTPSKPPNPPNPGPKTHMPRCPAPRLCPRPRPSPARRRPAPTWPRRARPPGCPPGRRR